MAYDVTVTRTQPEAWCEVRGEQHAVAAALAPSALALPATANTLLLDGERGVLWLGPRRWLLSGPVAHEPALQAIVDRVADDPAVSAAIVSDAYAGFDVAGPQVQDVLAQATPLDVRPEAFAIGAASFTRCFGITALVCCTAATAYRLYVDRSYADFMHACLARAVG